jgi:hypothetical protein
VGRRARKDVDDAALPAVHRFGAYADEAGRAEAPLEGAYAVEVEHAAAEVAVDRRARRGEGAGGDDDRARDEVPHEAGALGVGDRVLVEADHAARREQAEEVGEATIGVRDVADPVGHEDRVEGALRAGGGGIGGVAADPADVGGPGLAARDLQHAGGGVEAGELRVGVDLAQGGGGEASAAAEVEDPRARGLAEALGAVAEVPAVARVHPGEDVVAARDSIKVEGDAALLSGEGEGCVHVGSGLRRWR